MLIFPTVFPIVSTFRAASELEECRPRSAGEEEMQLQIALALSKEDAERDQEVVKSDDVRLQMALQESQGQPGRPTHHRAGQAPAGQSTSAAKVPVSWGVFFGGIDLLELNVIFWIPW